MERLSSWVILALVCLGAVTSQDTEVSIDVETKTVNEGDDIVLVCTSSEGYEMDWDHNGLVLENGENRVTIATRGSSGTKISTMTRSDATWLDSGTYKCMDRDDYYDIFDEAEVNVVKNGGGGGGDTSSHITIEPSEDFTKDEGDSVTFSCTCAMGSTLSWYRDNEKLSDGAGVSINEVEDGTAKTTMLTLDTVMARDTGTYACRGSGGNGPEVTMTVGGSDGDADQGDISLTPADDQNVDVDQSFSLTCECASCTELTWYLDGDKVQQVVGITITNMETGTRVAMLTVDAASASNAGTYTCQSAEGDSADITVNVAGDDDGGDDGDDDEDDDNSAGVVVGSVTLVALLSLRQWL